MDTSLQRVIFAMFVLLTGVEVVKSEDPFIVVGTGGGIVRMSLDGSGVRPVLEDTDVWSIAYDYASNYIFYWAAQGFSSGEIRRCSLSGEDDIPLATGVRVYGMAVDHVARQLYWTNFEPDHIEVCDYAGNNHRTLVTGQKNPNGITLDLEKRVMYWNGFNSGTIMTANMDGTSVATLKEGSGNDAEPIYLDPVTQQLFYGDIIANELRAFDLRDKSDTVIVPGVKVFGISMYADQLYFTDRRDDTIKRCDRAGRQLTTLASDISAYGILAIQRQVSEFPYAEVNTDNGGTTKFVCHMPSANGANAFLVDWLSGETELVTDERVAGTEAVMMMADIDHTRLDSNLHCRTRTVTVVDGEEQIGPMKESNVLEPQITLVDRKLELTEGSETASIGVRLTMPLFFFDLEEIHLTATLNKEDEELRDEQNTVIDQLVVEAVEGTRSSKNIVTNDNWHARHKFVLAATQDGKDDGTKKRTVKVNMSQRRRDILPTDAELGTTDVVIYNRDARSACKSWNDPRMRTFDGRYFSIYLEGEFVMYAHKYLNYQVNVMLTRCSKTSSGACNCAVAIRADDDVVILDKCSRRQQGDWTNNLLRTYILKDGDLTSGLTIWSLDDGHEHAVEFRHGGLVTVRENTFGALQVDYRPVPEDYENTIGLCGTYDMDGSNDFMMRNGTLLRNSRRTSDFSREWRARDNERSFAGVAPAGEVRVKSKVFCSVLEGQGEHCAEGLDKKYRSRTESDANSGVHRKKGKDITKDLQRRAKVSPRPGFPMVLAADHRRKRSLVTEFGNFNPFAPFVVDENWESEPTTWPTASGLTEAGARAHCERAIQSSEGAQRCGTMMSDNFDEMITDCVDDIGLTDDLSWANATVTTIIEHCLTFMDALDNSATDTGPPPALPGGMDRNQILAAVCARNCSGHGVCANGVCTCDAEYTNYDCSGKLTDPPELTSLEPMLCDMNSGSCDEVVVYGRGFQNRPELTCHLRSYTLGDTHNYSSTPEEVTLAADFSRYDEIICTVPSNGPHKIRISNDGVNAAIEELHYLKYNSTCLVCRMSGTNIESAVCNQKPYTCMIEGRCYEEKGLNPYDPCQKCDSTASDTHWTQVQGGGCGGMLHLAAIVVPVVVLLVVVGVMVGGFFYIRRKAFFQRAPDAPDPNATPENQAEMRVVVQPFGKVNGMYEDDSRIHESVSSTVHD